ncbi:MAG: radical SAM protein [Bacteroidales bacterium]|nr:radical SAM protein [Bacteroidales bacterium]
MDDANILKNRIKNKFNDKSCIKDNISFPREIKIDVSSSCNYKCIMCQHSIMQGGGITIDSKLCKKILSEAYSAGARECSFHFWGEPLLNKSLEDYILYAKNLGYEYVYFTTNGYLATIERSRKLLDAGLDSIRFSINASRENYKLVHGIDGYDRVLNNIKALYDYRIQSKSKCKIYVSFIATKQTALEASKVTIDVKEYVDDIVIIKVRNFGGIAKNIFKILEIGNDNYRQTYPCTQPFKDFCVSAEGYLLTCCFDAENKTVIADLNNCSVIEAWYSKKFEDFRKRHLAGDLKGTLCYNCLNSAEETVLSLTEDVNTPILDFSMEKEVMDRIHQIEENNLVNLVSDIRGYYP